MEKNPNKLDKGLKELISEEVFYFNSFYSLFQACTPEFDKLRFDRGRNHTYCNSTWTTIRSGVSFPLVQTDLYSSVLATVSFFSLQNKLESTQVKDLTGV